MEKREVIKMNTESLFLILLLILTMSCKSLHSQENKIEYTFSEEVNKAINAKLSEYKTSEYKLYITMSTARYTEDCGNYQLWIGTYKDVPNEAARRFIVHGNHYYKNGDLIVPVIFDYDLSFAFFGKDDKGRVIRKNVTGTDYLIEFDRSGKIVREGF